MKLYVKDKNHKKRYLKVVAPARSLLIFRLGGETFSIDGKSYHISEVKAEKSQENTALSAVIGGAVGLFGGMPGVLLGGFLGGLAGFDSDKKDSDRADQFNRS
jgi:hypothetical protein